LFDRLSQVMEIVSPPMKGLLVFFVTGLASDETQCFNAFAVVNRLANTV
jgi:hypothetical protein